MTIATVEPHGSSLPDQMQYADALAAASLVPDSFKRQPPNILVALAIAEDLAESPWTVMSEMSVIGGRPSFSAKFMRARVRKAGHKLRETFSGGVARCVIIRKDDPDFEHVSEWDEAKARQHEYWGKGHWRKNPELMLKNRALSECVREACYEVMGGVGYTPDEVEDFAPTTTVHQVETKASKPKPPTAADLMAEAPETVARDWTHEIESATTRAELLALLDQAPEQWREAIISAGKALSGEKAPEVVEGEVVP